jgi:hypothetical protein
MVVPAQNRAVYSGNHTDYVFQQVGTALQITDLRPGSPSGTDHVTHVQQFQFDDGIYSPTSGGWIPQPQPMQLAAAVEATNT